MRRNLFTSSYCWLLVGLIAGSSCMGPRNFYSAMPVVSPAPIEKGKVSVELFNGSNSSNHSLLATTDTKDHTLGARVFNMHNNHWGFFAEGFLNNAHSIVSANQSNY